LATPPRLLYIALRSSEPGTDLRHDEILEAIAALFHPNILAVFAFEGGCPLLRSRVLIMPAVLILAGLSGCAAIQDGTLGDILSGNLPLDESTVTAGLKEALRVGTERSTLTVGAVDGYLGNELIRIAVPPYLRGVTDKLRTIGMGSYVDEFEVGMNRDAEAAAGEARTVFWETITSMTIADAFGILDGPDDAATTYFVGRTRRTLETRYRPIADQAMQEVGLAQVYNRMLEVYDAIPLLSKPEMVELDEYVTTEALDGLFATLALEEGKIRNDPAARTSALLRRVFGGG